MNQLPPSGHRPSLSFNAPPSPAANPISPPSDFLFNLGMALLCLFFVGGAVYGTVWGLSEFAALSGQHKVEALGVLVAIFVAVGGGGLIWIASVRLTMMPARWLAERAEPRFRRWFPKNASVWIDDAELRRALKSTDCGFRPIVIAKIGPS